MISLIFNRLSSRTWLTLLGACLMVLALGAACNSDDGDHVAAVDPCATCGDGETCIDSVCYAPGCPPDGPFGTHPGEPLTDVVVYDCDDNPVHLHSLCGANVGYFNLLAGW